MDRKPDQQRIGEDFSTNAPRDVEFPHSWSHWFKDLFPNLRDAAIRWSDDDAGSLAASVAYYLALSLFPLMLLLTSGIGLFFEFSNFGRDAESQILEAVEQQTTPMVRDQIEEVLNQLRNQSIISGPTGIIAAILAAIGVFAQIDRGFDRIFRIPLKRSLNMRGTVLKILRHRFLAFLMLICLGGTILVLFASSMVISQIQSLTGETYPSLSHVFGLVETIATISINGILFGLVYRFLPKKQVHWTDAIRGGLLVAVIWELGRTLLGVFFIGMRYTSAYGVIGSFIAILLWCYYGISILFYGAEYVQVLEMRRASRLNSKERIGYDGERQSEPNQPSSSSSSSSDREESAKPSSIIDLANQSRSSKQTSNYVPNELAQDEQSDCSDLKRKSEVGRELPPSQIEDDRYQPRRSTN